MLTLGRTLLIAGFIITAVALLWLIFGSMEWPRGINVGDLEYNTGVANRNIPLVFALVAGGFLSVAFWIARRR